MKKIFATLLAASLMFAATDAFAQLSAGLGYINATDKSVYTANNGDKTTTETPLNGFYAGVQYDMPIPAVSGLGIEAGLYANYLFGSKHYDGLLGFGAGTDKYSELNLNVPVHATFGFNLSGDTNVFAFAGPTFQFGLSSSSTYILDSDKSSKNVTDNYADPDRNRFNLLIGGGIGAQVAGIRIVLGVDQSLLNYLTADNYTGSRFQLKLGVGYAF
ncbi:MAG: hypothetical protein J6W94_00170 [Bacteroidales bacterium]|nr:hypothetical protein [Bacteroidales bacterium]